LPPHTSPDQLPLLHRLAIIYLLLPVLVFLLGWFQWWLGVPAALLIAYSLWPLLRGACAWRLSAPHVAVILLAVAWVLLTGAGGVFDTNTNADWIKNDAILLDMSRAPWPTHLPTEGKQAEPLLRYYLGYYMVPALAGRLLGVAALNWAVPLWTSVGVALMMLIFTRHYRGWGLWLAAAILILFSGMDIIRIALFQDWSDIELGRSHIEWDYFHGMRVQYSSHMVGLMYVPQHFLAAGLYTLLLVELRGNGRFLQVSGVVLAASLFWSPFVALGLLPLVLVLLVENGLKRFLSWQNLLLALPLAGLILVYLLSGSANFPQGWLWQQYSASQLLMWIPVFLLNQFLLLAALLYAMQPALRREAFFWVAIASLLLLPWYQYGYFNDLAMRASLPAIFLLSYYSAQLCGQQATKFAGQHRGLVAALFIVLCTGAITPVFEVARVLNFDDGQRRHYEELDYTTLSTVHRFFRGQYRARNMPDWYRSLLRDHNNTETASKVEHD
jgi:hypothetical protein